MYTYGTFWRSLECGKVNVKIDQSRFFGKWYWVILVLILSYLRSFGRDWYRWLVGITVK